MQQQLVQVQKYFFETYLFQHLSKVHSIQKQQETNSLRLLLEENIFHPQGGGQPDDEGLIRFQDHDYPVKIINDRASERVYVDIPYDEQLSEQLQNQAVLQVVNEEKRRLYARLHSGGHFLDMCVKRLGYKWLPGKGYHFADGPYVEYVGTIEGKAEDLVKDLQATCDQVLQETQEADFKVVEYLNQDQLKQKLGSVPVYLQANPNVRYVQLNAYDDGCPCGGTHVNHVKEIGQVIVQKIQKKGKNVRVSYNIK